MTSHLPTSALRDLLATNGVVGPRELVEAIVNALDGAERTTLMLRVLPSADWDRLLSESEQKRAHTVLRVLIDGELWTRQALAERTRLNDRVLRDSIEDLRHAGFPIVSHSERPGGYRLTDDPDEIGEWLQREVTPRAMRMHELEGVMARAQQRTRAARDEGAVQPAQLSLVLT